MNKFRKSLSVILAVLMLAALISGCSARDVEQALQTVHDVAEILEEVEVEEESAPEEEAPAAEPPAEEVPDESSAESEPVLDEYGSYTTKEDVALYIHTYGCLPMNFMTKNEARDGGWEGGGLDPYFPGMCIGGDYFGNREGLLPDAKGRKWTECDINTLGASSRGAERIVFSNDGLIYYTGDHYESFELLYGEP